jgi:phospho-N-acetylmuramoyl-pentapeptide-transferase
MLDFLGHVSSTWWGPLRLFTSYFFLATSGSVLVALLTWRFLPILWLYLPTDGGRAHAFDAAASVGKPVGAGIILIGIIVLSILLFVPYDLKIYAMLPLLIIETIVGFIDDLSGGLSEVTLGLWDLALSASAAFVLFGSEPATIWMPFTSTVFVVPAWLNLAIVISVIWFSINAVNCNDGVDGLSGSLSAISIGAMGILFYAVFGRISQSTYLLIPHNPEGANWALACALIVGTLCGYLWHNVPPSSVLMGDAGSRPIGLFLGILIAVSQNPFLVLFCAFTILANGATGLVKVGLLRFLKVRIFTNIRFPLHDHVRKNLNWSNPQVLARFTLIHLGMTILLLSILLKVR